MKLKSISFSEEQIVRGIDAVREMTTLEGINGSRPETFWQKYDASGKPGH
jgi:hypothetical protein